MQLMAAIQDTFSINKGRHWKHFWARDVHPQNHLHRYHERVDGFSSFSSQRRRGLPERHSSSDCVGRFGYWIFVGPGSEETWNSDTLETPDNPEGIGIAKLYRRWKHTQNLAFSLFRNDDLRAGCCSPQRR